MDGFTGLYTIDGKPIYSNAFIEELREKESNK